MRKECWREWVIGAVSGDFMANKKEAEEDERAYYWKTREWNCNYFKEKKKGKRKEQKQRKSRCAWELLRI